MPPDEAFEGSFIIVNERRARSEAFPELPDLDEVPEIERGVGASTQACPGRRLHAV